MISRRALWNAGRPLATLPDDVYFLLVGRDSVEPVIDAALGSTESRPTKAARTQRLRAFFPFAFTFTAARFPRETFAAPFGPRNMRAGRSLMAARLNFRAARRAPSLPPYPLSLNNRVTVSLPRRKCT
jgi:hypothetical protein